MSSKQLDEAYAKAYFSILKKSAKKRISSGQPKPKGLARIGVIQDAEKAASRKAHKANRKFGSLFPGQVFKFYASPSEFDGSNGPWIKTGDRTYTGFHIGPNVWYGEHRVGSINVAVTNVRDPKSFSWVAFDSKGHSINASAGNFKPHAEKFSSNDPVLTSGIRAYVVQMFSGSGLVDSAPKNCKYVTIYAHGAETFRSQDFGIPIATYQRAVAGGKWRKAIFSPQHRLK